MGLQQQNSSNGSNSSALAAYSSNALCNLIEFSEQRFLRDEFAANSIAGLTNGNSNNSAHNSMIVAAAAHQQQQQLSQIVQQQTLQQLQQHHLQQIQQHYLQNATLNLTAANLQGQHLLNTSSNNSNGLLSNNNQSVNSSPGSNCSSPDAISQLSSTIKSEDHSNHSYISENTLRENQLALDKTRTLNPIELALNASVQKQLSAANKNSLSKSELKFSVRSILSEDARNLQNFQNSLANQNAKLLNSLENNNDKSNDAIKIPKKERIESPITKQSTLKTTDSLNSSSSSSSSSPVNSSELKINQQQSVKTIERRLNEKGMF